MRRHPTTGRLRAALGMIVLTAAGVAAISFAATTAAPPALAIGSVPTRIFGPMTFECYQNADFNSKVRYVATSVFIDQWDLAPDTPSTPVTIEALRYRYHLSKQNWDGSQYVIENDWEAFWGGPTQYVQISDSYFRPDMVCKNLIGLDFGIRAG